MLVLVDYSCKIVWIDLIVGDGVEPLAGPPPKGSTPYAPDVTIGSIIEADILPQIIIPGSLFGL